VASAFSHAVAAISIGTLFYEARVPKRIWIAGALCSALPDLDSIGFHFGIRYSDFWGHRGFTHSLAFAAILAALVSLVLGKVPSLGRAKLWFFLFLATASHGLLDAMTNGGLGIAFFSPFDNDRYFLPWRPIVVAPISIHRFFSGRGVEVMKSELLWIWLPAILFAAVVWLFRQTHSKGEIIIDPRGSRCEPVEQIKSPAISDRT
jgi:inner membrane protein